MELEMYLGRDVEIKCGQIFSVGKKASQIIETMGSIAMATKKQVPNRHGPIPDDIELVNVEAGNYLPDPAFSRLVIVTYAIGHF
jgi:hypothetical protein